MIILGLLLIIIFLEKIIAQLILKWEIWDFYPQYSYPNFYIALTFESI